jgi:hypothetical protein
VPGVKLATQPVRNSERVFFAGFPAQLKNVSFDRKPARPARTDGVVTSVNPINNSADFIGVDGMSGGPVLNSKGEMVGLFWGKEPNERDEGLFYVKDGKFGLPEKMPRETSYFIPVAHVKKAQPTKTIFQSIKETFGY